MNAAESSIEWIGSKPVVNGHNETINIKNGFVHVNTDNQITGGEFVIDMNSISNADLTDAEKKGQLEGHLKSADFFEVEKYPEAKFVITGVTPATDTDKKNLKTPHIW